MARRTMTEAAIRESELKNQELLRGLRQYIAQANIGYLQDADNFQKAMKVEEQVVKLSCDRITQMRQKLTTEMNAMSEAAEKRLLAIPQQIKAIQDTMADRKFTNQALAVRSSTPILCGAAASPATRRSSQPDAETGC